VSNVSIHERANVSDEEAKDETKTTESDTAVVWPPVRQCERFLGSHNDQWVLIASQNVCARGKDHLNLFESCIADQLSDVGKGGKTRLCRGVDNELGGKRLLRNDLGEVLGNTMEEEVCVHGKTDRTTNVTNTERNGGDGGDELVGTSNLRDDGAWNDDTTNANRCETDDGVHSTEVVWRRNSHGTGSTRHQSREEDHECTNAALGDGNEDETDDCATNDTEADRQGTDANTKGIIT
jgi:hypothetical protein